MKLRHVAQITRWKPRIILAFALLTIVALLRPAFGQSPKLDAEVSTTGRCPKSGQVYVGPHAAAQHWGTCLSAGGLELEAKEVRSKSCPEGFVYIGPNKPEEHGGTCVKVNHRRWQLLSQVARKKSDCTPPAVYAGPNKVAEHWGSCVWLVKK